MTLKPVSSRSGSGGGAAALIYQTTLSAPAASIEVTSASFPGSYHDLLIMFSGKSAKADVTDVMTVELNNDSSAVYQLQELSAVNTAASAAANLDGTAFACFINAGTSTTNAPTSLVMWIPAAGGGTFFKNMLTMIGASQAHSAGSQSLDFRQYMYGGTAPITDVLLGCSGNNFVAGTTLAVYALG